MNANLVSCFDIAPPALAESRVLQERVDRKYLLRARDLESLLSVLHPGHLVLPAGEALWARYESMYFDSPERDFYHAHRRGQRPRFKVRIRHHIDRQLTFLEVKRKESCGRTAKLRLPLPFGQSGFGTSERQFIEQHARVDATRLVPTVAISFMRLTLLGRSVNERLTLDRDLRAVASGRMAEMPPAVIAEVKQSQFANHEGAVAALRAMHAHEIAVSKYCLGILLSARVRGNTFKPVLQALQRLSV